MKNIQIRIAQENTQFMEARIAFFGSELETSLAVEWVIFGQR